MSEDFDLPELELDVECEAMGHGSASSGSLYSLVHDEGKAHYYTKTYHTYESCTEPVVKPVCRRFGEYVMGQDKGQTIVCEVCGERVPFEDCVQIVGYVNSSS